MHPVPCYNPRMHSPIETIIVNAKVRTLDPAKPFAEAEILMRAERKFKVVTQMGNQGHTSSGAAQFQQLVAAGLTNDVFKIDAWKEPSLWFMQSAKRISTYPPEEKLPETFSDWNL